MIVDSSAVLAIFFAEPEAAEAEAEEPEPEPEPAPAAESDGGERVKASPIAGDLLRAWRRWANR